MDEYLIFWLSAVFQIESWHFWKVHDTVRLRIVFVLRSRNNCQRLVCTANSQGFLNDYFGLILYVFATVAQQCPSWFERDEFSNNKNINDIWI